MIRAVVLLLLSAFPAFASFEGWPALYDVSGVEEGDVLNIRAMPDATAEIIGALEPDATDVEVIAPDESGKWGLVNTREFSGWVSLHYLARHPDQTDGQYPEFTACTGTEPFWSLSRSNGTATLDLAFGETPSLSEPILWETTSPNHRLRYSFGTDSMVGVVARRMCNDGMSDQVFGLELNLVLPADGTHLQGCCTLRPRADR